VETPRRRTSIARQGGARDASKKGLASDGKHPSRWVAGGPFSRISCVPPARPTEEADGDIQPRTAADGDERVLGVEVWSGGESPPLVHPPARARRLQKRHPAPAGEAPGSPRCRCTGEVRQTTAPRQRQIPNEKSRCSEWSEVRSPQAIVLRVVVLAANRRSRRARPQKAYRYLTGRDRGPDRGSGEHRRKRTATSAIVATICGSGPPQGSWKGGRCHRIAEGEARFTRASQEAVFDRRFGSTRSVRRAGHSVTGHPRSRAVTAVRRKCRPGSGRGHRSERVVVETNRSPWSSCGAARQRMAPGKNRGAESA
jgi:hypothetical protein